MEYYDFCIICHEDDKDLIEYNHCGKFYVHPECLIQWHIKHEKECIICRCELNTYTIKEYLGILTFGNKYRAFLTLLEIDEIQTRAPPKNLVKMYIYIGVAMIFISLYIHVINLNIDENAYLIEYDSL